MARYRHALPQLGGAVFLTDGGIETTLIFHEGLELPDFAAFHLLRTPAGAAALRKYFTTYADLARRHRTGLVLESATWRASRDWGARLGYDAAALAEANRGAIALLDGIAADLERDGVTTVVSGCVGPRGDGYVPGQTMSAAEAEAYHREAIDVLADTPADMITAITMNYVEEAIGVARAAAKAGLPSCIAFTVETDGRLPTGQTLGDAVAQVDAETRNGPAYFMINCAHPSHFADVLDPGAPWTRRIRGLRANASRQSHAELNEATELDAGDPAELGREYAAIRHRHPHLNVFGGCCGTDHRHVDAIATACRSV
jgi:S-methylmethionine-dependent homocysteine/selenocysteine methylase